MLGQVFNRIEREFGSAFWTMVEEAHPNVPPPIRRVDQEMSCYDDALQIRVRFEGETPMLALDIPARDLEYVPRANLNRIERDLFNLNARVQFGFELYLRWSAVGSKMIEHYDLDRDSIIAQALSVEANRLERLAVDSFPEAARKIQEEVVAQGSRFREVFAHCHSRATPVFQSGRDHFRDDRVTATELQMRMREAELRVQRQNQEIARRMQRHIEDAMLYGSSMMISGEGNVGIGTPAPSQPVYGQSITETIRAHERAIRLMGMDLGRGDSTTQFVVNAPYISRADAEERAWGLLLEHLTDPQRRGLERHGHFHVTGGRTGQTYRIRRGTQINIDVLGRGGRVVDRLCFQPRGAPTTGDTMLAQKVMLELDEDEALRAAVRHGPGGGAPVGFADIIRTGLADWADRAYDAPIPAVWRNVFGRTTS